jgi:hypothetical protein
MGNESTAENKESEDAAGGFVLEDVEYVTRLYRLKNTQLKARHGGKPKKALPEVLRAIGFEHVVMSGNTLVVRCEKSDAEVVDQVVAELDRPTVASEGYVLRVIWLASGVEGGAEVPEDLKKALGQLEQFGVTDLRLVGQNLARTATTQSVSTYFSSVVDGGIGMVSVSATVSNKQVGKTVRVQLSLSARRVMKSGNNGDNIASIDTA